MKIVLTQNEWEAMVACKDFLVANPSPCNGCNHVDCEACGRESDWDKEYKNYLAKIPDGAEIYDYIRAMVKIDTLLAEIEKLRGEFTAALKDVEQKRSQFVIE
jgi:hypothetical protein